MVCTNDRALEPLIRSLRSHGWNRDLDEETKLALREKHEVDPFTDQYTFYYPGYNFRGTDLGAFLGLRQLEKLTGFVEGRHRIWNDYQERFGGAAWRPAAPEGSMTSAFAYPMLSPDRTALAASLGAAGVETRPLICGSVGRQPWYVERHGAVELPNADRIHRNGMYVPINPDLAPEEVAEIAALCLDAPVGSVRGTVESGA